MSLAIMILVLLLVASVSWLAQSWLINVLNNYGVIDRPNHRTLHDRDVPRGGGIVIVFFIVLSLLLVGLISGRTAMFVTMAMIMMGWAWLSWWDDQHNLSPKIRIVFQLLLALTTMAAFGYINVVQFSSTASLSLGYGGALITLVGILWLTNLYNFMDGMDGLAASQTIIAAITIGFWLWQYGDQGLALICFVAAASSYGFMLRNWHPAKIFMGDVGSITLGAFFATLIIIASHRYGLPVISFVLLLGVFVFDASVTVLRRIWLGEQFWMPHRTHYYQRLVTAGNGQPQIVSVMIILMLICAINASISLLYRDIMWLCVAFELVLLGGAAWTSLRIKKNE